MKSSARWRTLLLVILLLVQHLANAQSATFSWVNQMGGLGLEYGQSLSTDAAGNVYTCGFFDGTVDFDPGPGTLSFTSQGLNDIFIQKVNTNGTLLWAKQIGGVGDDVSYMLTLNNVGEVVLTGYFSATVDFDPGPGNHTAVSNGSTDIYILKLDSNGQFVWVKTIGGAFDDGANAVSADLNGTIYCTGYFDNTVNFNPSSANAINLTSQGLDDVFFMKLSSAGNVKWAKSIGNSNYQAGNGIVANALGDIYISGFYYSTLDCDPGPSVFNIANNGLTDIFIEKVDSQGNFVWVKQIGGAGFESPLAMQLDATGNICHAGFFQQSIDFDPGIGTFNLSSNGGSDAYFEKLTPAGQFIYAKSFGGLLWDEINSISLDTIGNSYSTGFFQDTIDFDPGASIAKFASNGVRDIFVHKMDSAGTFIWAKQMGGTGDDWGNGIKVDLAGNVFTTGFFANLVDFNPGAGVANKLAFNDDAFVQKLQPCPPSYTTIAATNCASFTLNNQTFYQSGTYTQFKTNYLGSDSIITLNLTIVPASFTTIQQTICNGTSYFFSNQNLTQSGTYKDTLVNYRNCDSIVLLQLQVNNPIITSIPVSICAGNSYLFNGQVLQNSGSYYDTLIAASNCYSIIQLQLNVLPHSTYSFSNTNCSEQSFLFNGHLIHSTGLFYDTLSNYLNCDSIISRPSNILKLNA